MFSRQVMEGMLFSVTWVTILIFLKQTPLEMYFGQHFSMPLVKATLRTTPMMVDTYLQEIQPTLPQAHRSITFLKPILKAKVAVMKTGAMEGSRIILLQQR